MTPEQLTSALDALGVAATVEVRQQASADIGWTIHTTRGCYYTAGWQVDHRIAYMHGRATSPCRSCRGES